MAANNIIGIKFPFASSSAVRSSSLMRAKLFPVLAVRSSFAVKQIMMMNKASFPASVVRSSSAIKKIVMKPKLLVTFCSNNGEYEAILQPSLEELRQQLSDGTLEADDELLRLMNSVATAQEECKLVENLFHDLFYACVELCCDGKGYLVQDAYEWLKAKMQIKDEAEKALMKKLEEKK